MTKISDRRPRRWIVSTAAAALVVVGIGAVLYRSFVPAPSPVLRSTTDVVIENEVASKGTLPRDDFVLRVELQAPEAGLEGEFEAGCIQGLEKAAEGGARRMFAPVMASSLIVPARDDQPLIASISKDTLLGYCEQLLAAYRAL